MAKNDSRVHPTAVIETGAKVHPSCIVGAYAYVGPNVVMGENNHVMHHATVAGCSRIGAGNQFFPYSAIGTAPQDLSYKNEPTELVVGDHNVFREFVTVNVGTLKDTGKTVIGSKCLIMASCHIAHDCVLGDSIVMANAVLLGGHVHIGDYVNIGGCAAMHHFVTVGKHAFVGGFSRVPKDVPPYMLYEGDEVHTVNIVGLKRCGFSPERIAILKNAYKQLFRNRQDSIKKILEELEADGGITEDVRFLVQFIRNTGLSPHGRYLETLRKDGR